ncbi:toprim domain-containing protein [Candidatus Bathyarchaeota archaeon]|nr:toprim domain-containing protein [Candidatus Bathyarchaeota archaeon]MBS7613646.1 toprim domain-containing protein [Candidatus Bathyarchaeota archaeon]MBS7617592.1 toprim domain-containing protein [Candidatus Bathyarchaeota archaeon]
MKWTLERIELLTSILRELYDACENSVYVVEGRRDKLALRRLGFRGKIVALKTLNRSLNSIVENLCDERQIIILTDFDNEGEELATRLYKVFKSRNVEVNLEARRKLNSLLKGEIKGLEELEPLISRISQQFKTSLLFNRG